MGKLQKGGEIMNEKQIEYCEDCQREFEELYNGLCQDCDDEMFMTFWSGYDE